MLRVETVYLNGPATPSKSVGGPATWENVFRHGLPTSAGARAEPGEHPQGLAVRCDALLVAAATATVQ